MSDDTKVCPKCAETVRAEAKVCRHCGHTFGAVDESVPSSAPKKGGFLIKGLGCLGIALVVVLLIGVFAPEDASRSDNTAVTSSEPSASNPDPTTASDDVVEPEAATDEPTPDLTADNFERIRDGMTVEQVSDILGSRGEKVSESSAGGTTMTLYKWTGGMLSGRVVVGTFMDGKLNSKTQTGL